MINQGRNKFYSTCQIVNDIKRFSLSLTLQQHKLHCIFLVNFNRGSLMFEGKIVHTKMIGLFDKHSSLFSRTVCG